MTAASLWGKLEVRPVSVKLNLKIQSWDWVRQSCSLWRQPHAERRSINTDSRNVWTQILINNLWINNTDFTALKKLHFIHGHFYKIFFLEQSTKKTKEKNRINSNSSIKQSLLWRLWHFLIVAANAFFFPERAIKFAKGNLEQLLLLLQSSWTLSPGQVWVVLAAFQLLMPFLHIWISFKPQIQKPPKRSLLINRVSDQTTPGSLRCDYFRLSARINCVAADDCFIMDSSADHNLDSLFKKTWTTKTGEGFPVQELRVAVGYFPWIGASFNKEPLHFLLMQNPQWMGVTGAKSLKYLLTLLL